MTGNDQPLRDSPETLPELAADLERIAAGPGTPAGDALDAAFRRRIGEHFEARARRRAWRLRIVGGTAAAAALVAVSAVLVVPGRLGRRLATEQSVAAPAAARPADVDGDGVVDILDAYRLARRLESGEPLEPIHDLNGDGRVDGADVRYVALQAVRLPEGTG